MQTDHFPSRELFHVERGAEWIEDREQGWRLRAEFFKRARKTCEARLEDCEVDRGEVRRAMRWRQLANKGAVAEKKRACKEAPKVGKGKGPRRGKRPLYTPQSIYNQHVIIISAQRSLLYGIWKERKGDVGTEALRGDAGRRNHGLTESNSRT